MKTAGPSDETRRSIPKTEILVFLIVGLTLELIQGTLLPSFLRSQVVLVFVLYVGWHSLPLGGAMTGTIFGILEDYLFGVPVGLNGLSKTVLGFTASYMSRWSAPDLGALRALLIMVLALLDRTIVLGVLFLLEQEVTPVSLPGTLMAGAITGILGEVFFRLYDKIKFPPKDFRRF